jgi:protein gp37
MQKTGIEYLTHVWNFQTGCLNKRNGVCTLPCWAEAMAKRFHRSFEPELHINKIREALLLRNRSSRVGVCFTGDLFGDWISPELLVKDPFIHYDYMRLNDMVFQVIRQSRNQFFFLTKCPWNLAKWGKFPDNAWVGVTALNAEQVWLAIEALKGVDAKHKWLSLEPLQGSIFPLSWELNRYFVGINWIVIGGQTHPTKLPEKAWVDEIVAAADKANIPVFLKNNLKPLMGDNLRQELPK